MNRTRENPVPSRNSCSSVPRTIVYLVIFLALIVPVNSIFSQYVIRVPGMLVVRMTETPSPISVKYVDGLASIGIPSVDTLLVRHSVVRFEKMFKGFEVPAPGSNLIDLSKYYRVTFTAPSDLDEVMNEFLSDSFIDYVEPEIVVRTSLIPNDENFSQQWNLHQGSDKDIDMAEAWDVVTVNPEVALLAIVDTGVDWDHPDLANNVWINDAEWNGQSGVDDDGNGYVDDIRGWDWVHQDCDYQCLNDRCPDLYEDGINPDNDPTDFHGHGTQMAGIAGAITHNTEGIAGIAGGINPSAGARIMALRTAWRGCDGRGYVDLQNSAQAIDYARTMGAVAINCSWTSTYLQTLDDAVTNAVSAGIMVVVSAGNDNSDSADYLNSRSDVFSVAATNQNDQKEGSSNYGTWVDVSAPGDSIISTDWNDDYDYSSGTSAATAHVTGLSGLVKSYHNNYDRIKIGSIIRGSADDIYPDNPDSLRGQLGSGRINAYKALYPDLTLSKYTHKHGLGPKHSHPKLTWDCDELNVSSYKIYRRVDGGGWSNIGSTTSKSYIDYQVEINENGSKLVEYYVTAETSGGAESTPSNIVSTRFDGFPQKFLVLDILPLTFQLRQNFPNPFNPATTIKYDLPENSSVTLKMYNLMGQEIRTLLNGNINAGYQNVIWDGKDTNGNPVSSGMYLYRIDAISRESDEEFHMAKKMVLLR